MAETRNKSADTVEETRSDARRQTDEMEDKVYANYDNAEDTRRTIHQQVAEILA